MGLATLWTIQYLYILPKRRRREVQVTHELHILLTHHTSLHARFHHKSFTLDPQQIDQVPEPNTEAAFPVFKNIVLYIYSLYTVHRIWWYKWLTATLFEAFMTCLSVTCRLCPRGIPEWFMFFFVPTPPSTLSPLRGTQAKSLKAFKA